MKNMDFDFVGYILDERGKITIQNNGGTIDSKYAFNPLGVYEQFSIIGVSIEDVEVEIKHRIEQRKSIMSEEEIIAEIEKAKNLYRDSEAVLSNP